MNENKNSTEATENENSEIKMKIEGDSMNTDITINVRLDPHHVAPLLDEIRQTLAKQSGAESSKPDEPAFGDQLTDAEDEVWACGPDGKWRCWYSDVQQWSDELEPTLNRAVIETECGPLRPTTDEDRKRVGLPLRNEKAANPDEAHERQEHGPGTFGYCSERQARKDAEAKLADMTRQRDDLRGAVVTEPHILRMAAADIEARGTGFGRLPQSLPVTLRGLADVLGRDTQRGAKGEQQ